MKDVFISYKAEEIDKATEVKLALEENGISCWMAPVSIPGGSSYAAEITQAIRGAKVFVLILSPKAQESKWVGKEVDMAINEGKLILPFMIEQCELLDDFRFYLTNVQYYEAYENKAQALEMLIRDIKKALGMQTEEASLEVEEVVAEPPKQVKEKTKKSIEKPKESKKSKKSGIKWLLAASVLLVFMGVMVGIFMQKEPDSVKIAGKEFLLSEESLTFRDATITDKDIENLKKMKTIRYLSFYECTFETENLYQAVNQVESSLTINECNLSDQDVEKFDFSNSEIFSITLDDNPELSNLSFLAGLEEGLSSLSVQNCSVKNPEVLSAFTNLSSLNIAGNGISDLSSLSDMTDLYALNLANNNLSTLENLKNLTNLQDIDVSGNQLQSLHGLESAIKLSTICVANNQIADLNGIANATLISKADFSNNTIADVSILQKSKDTLRELYLSGNPIGDTSALEDCTKFTILNINQTDIATIDFISNLSELQFLYAENNRISDMSAISNCSKLIKIDLSDNVIVDVVMPQFENDVTLLDLSHNQITTLNLSPHTYTHIMLYGNVIRDFSCFNELTGSYIYFDYHADIDYEALGESAFLGFKIFDCPLDQQVAIEKALGYGVEFTSEEEYFQNKSNSQ